MNQIFFILNHSQNLFFLGALRGKKFLKIRGIQGIRANLRQFVQVGANPWHKSAHRRFFKARQWHKSARRWLAAAHRISYKTAFPAQNQRNPCKSVSIRISQKKKK